MSVSSRRQRATIYPYVATTQSGYPSSRYGPKRGTYWCRFISFVGNEATVAAQAEHRELGLFEFSDAVTVEEDDLISESGSQWKVESVVHRRNEREKIARVYRTNDAVPDELVDAIEEPEYDDGDSEVYTP